MKTKSPVYNSRTGRKYRCLNPKNKRWYRYGGRGITICDQWLDIESFEADMGPRPTPHHSIDRIDNAKGYSPENCRWATKFEQSRNRDCNRFVEISGVTYRAIDLAR